MPITALKRPVQRRIGSLVVEINETGLRIRGKHKGTRHWRSFSWTQVLSLIPENDPTLKDAPLIALELHNQLRVGKTALAHMTEPFHAARANKRRQP